MTRSRTCTKSPKGKDRHADNKPSKAQRKTTARLERRISAYPTNPPAGYQFHKPGSQNKNKK